MEYFKLFGKMWHKQKIEVYFTFLRTITNTQRDKRSEQAQDGRTLSPCVIQVFETSYEANVEAQKIFEVG
ncbi:14223_t:CDS:2 [Gigaspora rosea]|nr:14223_t:CDS:2 [Gigaspora rosea]